jgi:hypothetical protein
MNALPCGSRSEALRKFNVNKKLKRTLVSSNVKGCAPINVMINMVPGQQCYGSVIFCTDTDPDPATFVIDFQDGKKKILSIFAFYIPL